MGSLAGFGAPLTVRTGPYNSTEDALILAREVIDSGILADTSIDEKGAHIGLRRDILPGEKHQVVLWSPGHCMHVLRSDEIEQAHEMCWSLCLPQDCSAPKAMAVAYDGHRLGAWWQWNLGESIKDALEQGADPLELAAMVRWFKLPILANGFLNYVKSLCHSHPDQVLAAWVLGKGLPAPLVLGPESEEWTSAIRHVFSEWETREGQGVRIIDILGDDAEDHPFLEAARKLLRIDSLLMGKVLQSWCESLIDLEDRRGARALLGSLCGEIMGGTEESTHSRNAFRREKAMCDYIASILQVDTAFVEWGLIRRAVDDFRGTRPLSPSDRTNVSIAIGVSLFREYLGAKIIEAILQKMR